MGNGKFRIGNYCRTNGFKKGNKLATGNPAWADLKEAREILKEDFERVAQRVMRMTHAELNAFVKDPNTTVLELTVAAIMGKAISHGDQSRLNFILDRTVGATIKKVQVQTAEDSDSPHAPVAALTADEVTRTLSTLQRMIQKKEEEALQIEAATSAEAVK